MSGVQDVVFETQLLDLTAACRKNYSGPLLLIDLEPRTVVSFDDNMRYRDLDIHNGVGNLVPDCPSG